MKEKGKTKKKWEEKVKKIIKEILKIEFQSQDDWEKKEVKLGEQHLMNKILEREIYQDKYMEYLDSQYLKKLGGKYHHRIVSLVTDPTDAGVYYNVKHTGNPVIDVKRNYKKALEDILNGNVKKVKAKIPISKEAKEFADYFNFSKKDIQSALSCKLF